MRSINPRAAKRCRGYISKGGGLSLRAAEVFIDAPHPTCE